MNQASATSAPTSVVEETSQADSRPRLMRVDQQSSTPNARKLRHFSITIQSVYYYPSAGSICCAVLLRTAFKLGSGENLACAIVPLTVRPPPSAVQGGQAQGARLVAEQNIHISNHIPHKSEYVPLGQRSEVNNSSIAPNLKVNVLGTGAEVSGIGVTKQRTESTLFTISLIPTLDTPYGQPDCLQWKYEDRNLKGIFYPSSTDIMVIVERTDRPDMNWFPFELRLEWDLRVDVHGKVDPLNILRYMVKLGKHDGWCFQIKGNFNADKAKEALLAALDSNGNITHIPPDIGLDAAVPAMMRATMSTAT